MRRLIFLNLVFFVLSARDPFSARHYEKKTAGFVLKGTIMCASPCADLEYAGQHYFVGVHDKVGKYTVIEIDDGAVSLKKGEQVVRLRLKEADGVSKKK